MPTRNVIEVEAQALHTGFKGSFTRKGNQAGKEHGVLMRWRTKAAPFHENNVRHVTPEMHW